VFPTLIGIVRQLSNNDSSVAVPRYTALASADAPAQIARVEQTGSFDLLRLERVAADGTQSWLSQDGTSFAMQEGILVATRGFGGDTMFSDVSQTRALLQSGQVGNVHRFESHLDGDHQIVQESYVCEITQNGPVDLDIITEMVPANLVTEVCYGARRDFTNLYWIDRRSGKIRQSRQYAGSLAGMVALREVSAALAASMTGEGPPLTATTGNIVRVTPQRPLGEALP
jgi:hypothetical protein